MGGGAIPNEDLKGRSKRVAGSVKARVEALAQPVAGHELADIRFERRTAISPRSARALGIVVVAMGMVVGGGMLIGNMIGARSDAGVVTVGGLSPTEVNEATSVDSPERAEIKGDSDTPGQRGSAQVNGGSAPGMVVVAVQGMVGSPGLRTVSSATRLGELVNLAGGPLPEAHLEGINLAEKVVDGMQLVVDGAGSRVSYPGQSAISASGAVGGSANEMRDGGSGGSATVNINTADSAGLSTLPGVGPKTAEAIISWREANGPFMAPEQLMEVKGIGVAKFEALRASVSI